MFGTSPIDKNFVPYTKRPVLRRNAGLFVRTTGGGGRAARGALVAPQNTGCAGKANGTPCGSYPGMACCDGECKFGSC
jgi:hypothetical protein